MHTLHTKVMCTIEFLPLLQAFIEKGFTILDEIIYEDLHHRHTSKHARANDQQNYCILKSASKSLSSQRPLSPPESPTLDPHGVRHQFWCFLSSRWTTRTKTHAPNGSELMRPNAQTLLTLNLFFLFPFPAFPLRFSILHFRATRTRLT